jgi:hypothetical protein
VTLWISIERCLDVTEPLRMELQKILKVAVFMKAQPFDLIDSSSPNLWSTLTKFRIRFLQLTKLFCVMLDAAGY